MREYARLVLLDTLGVILAGSVQPEVASARTRLTATGGHGATIYAPGPPPADPRTAAFLNGLAGRSLELCEGHRYVACQGAVQTLPTAWNGRPAGRVILLLVGRHGGRIIDRGGAWGQDRGERPCSRVSTVRRACGGPS